MSLNGIAPSFINHNFIYLYVSCNYERKPGNNNACPFVCGAAEKENSGLNVLFVFTEIIIIIQKICSAHISTPLGAQGVNPETPGQAPSLS